MLKALIAVLAISGSAVCAMQFDAQDVNVAYALRCRGHLSNRQVQLRERIRAANESTPDASSAAPAQTVPYAPVPAEMLGH